MAFSSSASIDSAVESTLDFSKKEFSLTKISFVKLNDDNYLLWKHQVVTALGHYDLEGHFDRDTSSMVLPRSAAHPPDAPPPPNPVYAKWKHQDKVISSWLLGSMIEVIFHLVLNCKTAKKIWVCLQKTFTACNLVQVMKLRTRLHTLQKEGMPLPDYFSHIQQCVDGLSAVGRSVPEEDHILYILTGLGHEYESIITVLSAMSTSQNLPDVTTLILNHESRIEGRLFGAPSTLPSANMAISTSTLSSQPTATESIGYLFLSLRYSFSWLISCFWIQGPWRSISLS